MAITIKANKVVEKILRNVGRYLGMLRRSLPFPTGAAINRAYLLDAAWRTYLYHTG